MLKFLLWGLSTNGSIQPSLCDFWPGESIDYRPLEHRHWSSSQGIRRATLPQSRWSALRASIYLESLLQPKLRPFG
ncbi:hypothetical protein BVC80_9039g2 [Macleaya cordata]|uniref:Uncharacterized protein n=1 Tax=Macleaya cordata TaxID=56857 RepID=A0A200QY94_MACCD|nr:hypothetical protein BVC80_9039g2 [Macleaya cordata]